MRTLKRYFNLTDASLDRTVLEDYEISCTLFDEHSHAVGLYIAIPVRLMVADGQVRHAARILSCAETSPIPEDDTAPYDEHAAVRILDERVFGEDEQTIGSGESPKPNNPWEILFIAYLFLIPGIGFLLEQLPLLLWVGRRGRNGWLMLSPFDLHLVAAALICIAILLILFYFRARKAIARDASAPSDV